MQDSTFQPPCTTSAKRCLDSSSCMCAPDAQSEQCVPTRRTSALCFWLRWFIPLILRETMQKQFIVVLNGSKLSNHTSPWSTIDKHSMHIIFKALILFTQTFIKNDWSVLICIVKCRSCFQCKNIPSSSTIFWNALDVIWKTHILPSRSEVKRCGIVAFQKALLLLQLLFMHTYINLHALIVHFCILCWWNIGLQSFAFDTCKVCNKIFICAFTVITGENNEKSYDGISTLQKKTIYEKQQSWLPHDINKRGCTCNLRREQPDTTRVSMNRLLYQHKRMWDN